MDKSIFCSVAFGLIVSSMSLPLYAQTDPAAESVRDETIAKVETDGGVIMISEEQEEFETAVPDQRVKAKTRLMVSEDSSATVVYDNGCDRKYDEPGIYEISSSCVLPFLLGSSALQTSVAVVAGGVISQLITRDDGDCRPPVSR